MANNWRGYLLKAIDVRGVGHIFPDKYIAAESWDTTPNQREEIKAYRDENTRELHRITASGKKTIFSFKTRNHLHLEDKIIIQAFFTDNEVDNEQRKIQLEYWNDEDNQYHTGYFYRPNEQFTIERYTDTDVIYKEMTFEFIEY